MPKSLKVEWLPFHTIKPNLIGIMEEVHGDPMDNEVPTDEVNDELANQRPPAVQWTRTFKSPFSNLHRLHGFFVRRHFVQKCKDMIDVSVRCGACP